MESAESAAPIKNRVQRIHKANQIFDRVRRESLDQVKGGAKELDVLKLCADAGLKVSEQTLFQLQIPQRLIPHPFLSWDQWFPWRALWDHYWSLEAPGSLPATLHAGRVAQNPASLIAEISLPSDPCP